MLVCAKTLAHPHVWIENSIVFRMENKKITEINVNWVYDEFYSSAAFFEADIDNDNKLNTEEKLKLLDRNYEELKKNSFFIHLKLNEAKLNNFEIKNFNSFFKDEILTTVFTISLINPVDPFKDMLIAGFFDKTYFIDIYFTEKTPAMLAGPTIEACKYNLYEDMTETYYYGMVNPEKIKVICK